MKLNRRGIIVHPEDLTLDWIERMADAGLNTLGLHPVGGVKAHESLQRAIDWHATEESRALREAAAQRGIFVEYEAHVMAWLLPREMFAEHPDWFRMNEKGERVADFNVCASNPEALEFVAERTALLSSLLDTGSDKHYYWLDDVTDCACHCPACRGLSPADQQLKIVNAMVSGLKKRNPAAKLCYLAYHDALEVPANVKPADGVFLEYAPIRRDHHRPIADPGCEKNAAEVQPLPALVDFFGTEDARILDYWMDNSLFSNWTKPPKLFKLDEAVLAADVDFYKDLGFGEITSFGCYLGPDYEALYGKAELKAYADALR